ncbi:hypothetical protein [Legionella feeleii]|uniref:Transglycosylase associated protein n=1 Tax=Legionella feeleii TaxID=453 RepID=A0A0W0TZP8_9GAMM|nr:hypothetical protein [Legionella feeleii]KTD01192.1 hypothetical protein Lfee_1229 [Legionella feeleii]SPX62298.1 Uncharacterised protein [Legionella feeleii]STX37928.1 Uncharacterised protein [Legionella feeleii]
MDLVSLGVNLLSGLVGGRLLGAAWKDKSLGGLGNSIAGIIGGAAGGYILQAVGILNSLGFGDMSIHALLGNVGSGLVGGAVLTAIAGMIKKSMSKA